MADNENTITLVGRIGQEPELRATSKGDVLNFNVATNERKRNADNSWSDGPTSWFRVSAWNDLARNAHASFHRGQLVIVRGVLTVREFSVESGGKSRQAELRATALGHDLRWGTSAFTDAARTSAAPQSAPAAQQQTAPPAQQQPALVGSGPDGETEPAPVREPVPAGAPTNWGTSFDDESPF